MTGGWAYLSFLIPLPLLRIADSERAAYSLSAKLAAQYAATMSSANAITTVNVSFISAKRISTSAANAATVNNANNAVNATDLR